MPNSVDYNSLLNDLNREVQKANPADALQFCADWFQSRLSEQRILSRSLSSSSISSSSPAAHSLLPSSSSPSHSPSSPSRQAALPGSIAARRSLNMTLPSSFGQSGTFNFTPAQPSPFSEHPPDNSFFGGGGGGGSSSLSLASSSVPHGSSAHAIFNNVSPFAAPSAMAPPMSSALNPDAAEDDEIRRNMNLGRRTSVSAESLIPLSAGAEPVGKIVIPKTANQRQRIEASIAPNFLFRDLDDEQHVDVVNAMEEVHISADERVIEEGAVGDFFYVVESGELDVFIRGPNSDGNGNGDGGLGKKVHHYTSGGSFGELALMYNAPRAASVVTVTPCTLWRLDRVTFRSILLEHTSRKRKLYEALFSSVPILSGLEAHERAKVADALESKMFEQGQDIIQQGARGEEFFIIESGNAQVIKDGKIVGYLGRGDYFGELALLNSAPRSATVRVCHSSEVPQDTSHAGDPESTPKLNKDSQEFAASETSGARMRVATLQERAFTRLLGPVHEIMKRRVNQGAYDDAQE